MVYFIVSHSFQKNKVTLHIGVLYMKKLFLLLTLFFALVISIVGAILGIGGLILRSLFSWSSNKQEEQQRHYHSTSQEKETIPTRPKVIQDDEGEYVEFEETKE